jgi:amidase
MAFRFVRTVMVAALCCAFASPGFADDTGSHALAVSERSVAQLQAELMHGSVTAVALTQAYLDRIAAIDAAGPTLHSVIATNPHALDDARASDLRRAAGKTRGALEGIPVLLKDNIETSDGSATTAGSLALAQNVARRDAPLVVRLEAAGAIVLGKTNLSEWANFRSSQSISGWSAVGGLVRNPYALDRTACGSSAGTGSAIAASLAAVGVGSETDGSVTCPAAINGLVGLKPTLGLVSRTSIVPISHHQDTAGPMGRSVADVAALLTAIAGSDPRDPATKAADAHKVDYVRALRGASLQGKRFGYVRYASAFAGPAELAVFDRALATLRARGASIVTIDDFKPNPALGAAELTILVTDFKAELNAYLASTPPSVKTRSLAALIAFDRSNSRELGLFGQDIFVQAQASKGIGDPSYRRALATAARYARTEGIDRLLARYKLDALIAPTFTPASRVDVVDGDNVAGAIGSIAAVAGYPHLTVPMGYVRGLPVGLSFVGGAWSDASLLAIGAAFESASHARVPPQYAPSVESRPAITRLLSR